MNVSWYVAGGYGLYLSVGQPSGQGLPCPAGAQSRGSCAFVSLGGMYTLNFHAPVPAPEPGYTANFTVTFIEP